MRTLRLAFVGMGNVARAVWAGLDEYRTAFAQNNVALVVTGAVTRSAGILHRDKGLCPEDWRAHAAAPTAGGCSVPEILAWLAKRPADVLIELSSLNPSMGQPAINYISTAFAAGMHVVTANKGPQAFAFRQLAAEAHRSGVGYRFESAVLDGIPVFRMPRAMPGCHVVAFDGIVNSTTNLILTSIEAGGSFEVALDEARQLGITEADAAYDIEGWDAAVKTAVLSNVLLGADIQPAHVARCGIGSVEVTRISEPHTCRRLIASGDIRTGQFSVGLRSFPLSHLYAAVRGTSNALTLEFQGFGPLMLVEPAPTLRQTAYGVIADLLAISAGDLWPI